MSILRHRLRRLRSHPVLRELLAETQVNSAKLVLPLFITEGKDVQIPQKNLTPTSFTFSIDRCVKFLKPLVGEGIQTVLLFGVTKKKDTRGTEALRKDGIIPRAISEIAESFPNLVIGTDIALDPYTDHGHDGIYENGEILNDATVEVLSEMSVLHAKAGAHIVAPSDMMDGRVAAIRQELEGSGFSNTVILSYTAKYASALYGPFREALGAEVKGDKKTYQMDPRNRREALRELKVDIEEGADIVMVKPASWYLDIIADFKSHSPEIPLAAYQVSGEIAMIEAAATSGALDRDRAILESATSIFRAGADILVTYFAPDLMRLSRK